MAYANALNIISMDNQLLINQWLIEELQFMPRIDHKLHEKEILDNKKKLINCNSLVIAQLILPALWCTIFSYLFSNKPAELRTSSSSSSADLELPHFEEIPETSLDNTVSNVLSPQVK